MDQRSSKAVAGAGGGQMVEDEKCNLEVCQPMSSMACITDMPDDIIFVLLSFCDRQTLGRLSRVSRRLNHFVKLDAVWLRLKRCLTVVGQNITYSERKRTLPPVVEQCRVALNWRKASCNKSDLFTNQDRQMPWLRLYNDQLYISQDNLIRSYCIRKNRHQLPRLQKILRPHQHDISKFVCNGDIIVSGAVDGSVTACNAYSGQILTHYNHAHDDDVLAVDAHNDIIISGSRDASVKVWNTSLINSHSPVHTMHISDRVISLAICPNGKSFTVGTAGIVFRQPLQVWDFERTTLVGSLGSGYKRGAGILDIIYETSNVLLSGGYDTVIRLWDLRTSYTNCMLSWEEPYDSAIYCIQSDGSNAVLAGTSRHAVIGLWDKRRAQTPVCTYHTKYGSTSPVFSLAFDSSCLYVGLDSGTHLLNFS